MSQSRLTNIKKNYTSSFKLISKENQSKDSPSYNLEVTNEGMEYLNQLNSNLIGIISIIGPEKSEKSDFANLILGDKAAFDSSKPTSGIYMYGQPIAQGQNTDLIVLDTEALYKNVNSKTNYDKETFILSCLTSSIMIYNTNETIQDCINKFTNLAKESLSSIKKIEGKDLTSTDMPLVYFILHNNNIDSNTANQQFRNLVKDNPIFSVFFQNYKICVLKKAGDIKQELKPKSNLGLKIEEIGSLDDQDYKQKSKLVRDQIMNDLEPKKINNCNIDGKCLFGIIQSFVDSLNKNEYIILFNQFNNVLALCLSDVVDNINYSFTLDKLKEKMTSNISYEETFLDGVKATFNECIIEQYDKFKSTPIVKISPSINVIESIKLIFNKCLNLLCENIQASVDKKTQIINQTSKIEFTGKIRNSSVEELLNEYTCFLEEKIFAPLFEKNELKIQNNDKILQVLKDKVCGSLGKFSPGIQGIINKLLDENKKLKNEFIAFKTNHLNEIEKKDDEIIRMKLKIDKSERELHQSRLTTQNTINSEQQKYRQLEEKYNKEINEKNNQIKELLKNANNNANIVNEGNANVDNMNINPLESLKKDYNDITDIFVNYKILVNKLINDKDFFFGNILIDKNVGNLKKKYPEIFDLLSEKESLEECSKAFEKEKERLNSIINDYKEKNNELENEIKELNEKLENSKTIIEEKGRLYDVKVSNFKDLQELHTDLKFKMQENEVKFKDNLKKAKDEEFLRVKNLFVREINGLNDVIQSIFSKDKSRFDQSLEKLSQDSKTNLINLASLYKPKWG